MIRLLICDDQVFVCEGLRAILSTDPDIEVDNTPQDWAAGRDAQLERAIAEALTSLEQRPSLVPNLLPPPSRAQPRLPGRVGARGESRT